MSTNAGGGTNSTPGNGTNGPVNSFLWVDDRIPAGAVGSGDGGDGWNWVTANPAPFTGASAHQSTIGFGLHQHYFDWATQLMDVSAGDTLYAYVYLDPANLPSEIMLQWNENGNWDHRAYWGGNKIQYGFDNTASRRNMGALPAAGQWVKLEVPASSVGLVREAAANLDHPHIRRTRHVGCGGQGRDSADWRKPWHGPERLASGDRDSDAAKRSGARQRSWRVYVHAHRSNQ